MMLTRHSSAWLCLLLLITATSAAQNFRWDQKHWQELTANQSLRNARLPKSNKEALVRAISDQLRPMISELEKTEGQLRKAALDTRIKMIDLNQDGAPEVVAQVWWIAVQQEIVRFGYFGEWDRSISFC